MFQLTKEQVRGVFLAQREAGFLLIYWQAWARDFSFFSWCANRRDSATDHAFAGTVEGAD